MEMLEVHTISGKEILSLSHEQLQHLCAKQSDAVRTLKRCMQKALGVTRFRQRVSHQDRILTDDEPLSQLKLPANLQVAILPLRPESREEAAFLLESAQSGHLREVEKLLSWPLDPDAENEFYKETALTLASSQARPDCARALLEARADVNKRNWNSQSALWVAAFWGHAAVLKLLIKAKAELECPRADVAPLWTAAQRGHAQAVRVLVEAGADKDRTNKDGQSPLWIAACSGQVNVIQTLIELGADKERRNKSSLTPLFIAAHMDHGPAVQALAQAQADINSLSGKVTGTNGMPSLNCASPLWTAAANNRSSSVKALLELGADKNLANRAGQSPLWIAASLGSDQAFALLTEAGADKEQKSKSGCTANLTPLEIATRNTRTDILFYIRNGVMPQKSCFMPKSRLNMKMGALTHPTKRMRR